MNLSKLCEGLPPFFTTRTLKGDSATSRRLLGWLASEIRAGRPLHPALAEWLAGSLDAAASGADARDALHVRKRAGRPSGLDEFLGAWELGLDVAERREAGATWASAIEMVAEEHGVSESTVRRSYEALTTWRWARTWRKHADEWRPLLKAREDA